jgi:hypothetical protein
LTSLLEEMISESSEVSRCEDVTPRRGWELLPRTSLFADLRTFHHF